MDGTRFDSLARSLTDVRSRRGALAVVLDGALGLASLAETAAKRKKKKKKKPPQPQPQCMGATKLCGQGCIPTSSCCTPCGPLGACTDGACDCLEGGKACQGSCIPVANCCNSADCGANAVCVNGACMCLTGFKTCQGNCIPLGTCCTNELICGADQDGSCLCEQASSGQQVCHKDVLEAVFAMCASCPDGTICVYANNIAKCYKLCGAA